MTDYFEVHARDSAARRGELRLAESVPTPALVGDILEDAGSRWHEAREVPAGDEAALTVLPHRALPRGTEPPVAEAFAPEYPDVEFPSAAVVSPETAADHGTDAYLLSGAPGYAGDAEAFIDAVIAVRGSIPDDAALGLVEQVDAGVRERRGVGRGRNAREAERGVVGN